MLKLTSWTGGFLIFGYTTCAIDTTPTCSVRGLGGIKFNFPWMNMDVVCLRLASTRVYGSFLLRMVARRSSVGGEANMRSLQRSL